MASEHTRDDEDSGFSFGVRELRQARAAQRPGSTEPAKESTLVTVRPAKLGHESSGNDPYNTSGSFDRSRNWSRVTKR